MFPALTTPLRGFEIYSRHRLDCDSYCVKSRAFLGWRAPVRCAGNGRVE
jgi:hypothetical protein